MKRFTSILLIIAFSFVMTFNSFTSNSIGSTYTNTEFGYSLPIDGLILSENSSTHDDSVVFKDESGIFSFEIGCDRLDSETLELMRIYLKDYTSSEDYIFRKFYEYKESFFSALEESFKRNFLFGEIDDGLSESNMKVFKNYYEKLYGETSHIVLYNIANFKSGLSEEETHLYISVPSSSKKEIYSLHFIINKDNLKSDVIKRISALINSLSIHHLAPQTEPLQALNDETLLESVRLGVYPDLNSIDVEYSRLTNSNMGYEIIFPSTFIPYLQNNLAYTLDYRSFKIDFSNNFSISTEPIIDKTIGAINYRFNLLEKTHKSKISIKQKGIMHIGDNYYTYMNYEISDNNETTYYKDFSIVNDSKLFTLGLCSKDLKPSDTIIGEFYKILGSLKFIESQGIASNKKNTSDSAATFYNNERNYSISFPKNWLLSEVSSGNPKLKMYEIKNPDLSGPLSILISEGEFWLQPSYSSIAALSANSKSQELSKILKRYRAPYLDRPAKILSNKINKKMGTTYINKSVNYIDTNGRMKTGFIVDIVHNRQVFSLFITLSDYMIKDGKISDKTLEAAINDIIGSFKYEKQRIKPQPARANTLK